MDSSSGLVLSDMAYNRLKWVAMIVLPAVGALYYGFSEIWGLPRGADVVGSLAILGTFMGAVLGISTKAYNRVDDSDGVVGANGVNPDTGLPNLSMTINKSPDELLGKKTVRLRVDPNSAPGVPPQ